MKKNNDKLDMDDSTEKEQPVFKKLKFGKLEKIEFEEVELIHAVGGPVSPISGGFEGITNGGLAGGGLTNGGTSGGTTTGGFLSQPPGAIAQTGTSGGYQI